MSYVALPLPATGVLATGFWHPSLTSPKDCQGTIQIAHRGKELRTTREIKARVLN